MDGFDREGSVKCVITKPEPKIFPQEAGKVQSMKLSEEERKHRVEVRENMAKIRRYQARKYRHVFFDDLRRRALTKSHIDTVKFLKWCLRACYRDKIKPNLGEIKDVFKQINSIAPTITQSIIEHLPFEKRNKNGFTKLFDEALENAKYREIKRQELQHLKDKALRTRIRVEVEEEFRKQLRREMGLPKVSEARTIPEDVRFEVWRRDGGKCVKCGSQKELEFDHIIPFSKDGSNTARNIQLLCETCNRSKGNSI